MTIPSRGHDPAGDDSTAPRRPDPIIPRHPDGPSAAELAALHRLDDRWPDPDDDPGYRGPGSWPTDLPGEEGEPADPDQDETAAPEALDAGFTHRFGGAGAGFAAGGPLDVMLPGPDLAWHAGQARQRELDTLSDDELIGVLGAAGRLESWSAGLKLAAVAELDARRAGPDGREGEHVAEELAAALTLTSRSAGSLLELSRRLERLPQAQALLAAGVIDRARAAVIADQLSILPDDAAAAVEDRIAPRAAGMTTGQLTGACQRAVLAHDPQAAARRREKAEKDARVECWAEPSGTGAIAGRDLSLAGVIAADKHLDAAARWLQRHGAPGTMDQLRAQAFLARLAGQPLDTLLPRPAGRGGPAGADPGGTAGPNPGGSGGPLPGTPASPGSCAAGPGGPSGLTGSVNLIMPATTWLGLTDTPGEAGGTGTIDAGTCRDLAALLAARDDSRWCITLTERHGRAVAHGCARAGPGPPGTSGPAAWLTRITIIPIETGTCTHRHESAGYRPSPGLRHLVKIRSPRCGYPGCRRPAARCDDDHTIAHHKGGKTCECNLFPLCRRHHQAKQAPGWYLSQPEPGVLAWTTPSGRRYTVTPKPYPA